MPSLLARLERYGFLNYFDQQRFGSYVPGHDWVGKRILLRDAEGALRAHLAQRFVGDPPRVRMFKSEAKQPWAEWRYLLEQAPKPSNSRSVQTYLADHPQGYRKALNLITARLLSLYLAAYQSLLSNRLAGRYLRTALKEGGADPAGPLGVAGEPLPFYAGLPPPVLGSLKTVMTPLFHHRTVGSDSRLTALVEQVLAEEGMRRGDCKARLLNRAYLARGEPALLVFPREVSSREAAVDDATPGRYRLTISFVLSRGSYSTLLLKLLAQPCLRHGKTLA